MVREWVCAAAPSREATGEGNTELCRGKNTPARWLCGRARTERKDEQGGCGQEQGHTPQTLWEKLTGTDQGPVSVRPGQDQPHLPGQHPLSLRRRGQIPGIRSHGPTPSVTKAAAPSLPGATARLRAVLQRHQDRLGAEPKGRPGKPQAQRWRWESKRGSPAPFRPHRGCLSRGAGIWQGGQAWHDDIFPAQAPQLWEWAGHRWKVLSTWGWRQAASESAKPLDSCPLPAGTLESQTCHKSPGLCSGCQPCSPESSWAQRTVWPSDWALLRDQDTRATCTQQQLSKSKQM